MPRKAKKKDNISIEPILQDYSVTSLSDIQPDTLCPSDSSIFNLIGDYDVALPNLTLDRTEDLNISSGPYPPDSTIVADITETEESGSSFRKPFNVRARKKPRPSLFELDMINSETSSPESAPGRPFKRQHKIPINPAIFDIDSSNNSLNLSKSVQNFITRRKARAKRNVEKRLFDTDLNTSESKNSLVSSHPFLNKRKIISNKKRSAIFDRVFDDTLTGSQSEKSLTQQLPFKNVKNKHKNLDSSIFNSDLNSSDSDQQSSFKKPFKTVRSKLRGVDPCIFDNDLNSPDSFRQSSSHTLLEKSKINDSTIIETEEFLFDNCNKNNTLGNGWDNLSNGHKSTEEENICYDSFDGSKRKESINVQKEDIEKCIKNNTSRSVDDSLEIENNPSKEEMADSAVFNQHSLNSYQRPFTNVKSIKRNVDLGLFDSDLNSSNSVQQSYIEVPFKRINSRQKNIKEGMFDIEMNSFNSTEKSSVYVSPIIECDKNKLSLLESNQLTNENDNFVNENKVQGQKNNNSDTVNSHLNSSNLDQQPSSYVSFEKNHVKELFQNKHIEICSDIDMPKNENIMCRLETSIQATSETTSNVTSGSKVLEQFKDTIIEGREAVIDKDELTEWSKTKSCEGNKYKKIENCGENVVNSRADNIPDVKNYQIMINIEDMEDSLILQMEHSEENNMISAKTDSRIDTGKEVGEEKENDFYLDQITYKNKVCVNNKSSEVECHLEEIEHLKENSILQEKSNKILNKTEKKGNLKTSNTQNKQKRNGIPLITSCDREIKTTFTEYILNDNKMTSLVYKENYTDSHKFQTNILNESKILSPIININKDMTKEINCVDGPSGRKLSGVFFTEITNDSGKAIVSSTPHLKKRKVSFKPDDDIILSPKSVINNSFCRQHQSMTNNRYSQINKSNFSLESLILDRSENVTSVSAFLDINPSRSKSSSDNMITESNFSGTKCTSNDAIDKKSPHGISSHVYSKDIDESTSKVIRKEDASSLEADGTKCISEEKTMEDESEEKTLENKSEEKTMEDDSEEMDEEGNLVEEETQEEGTSVEEKTVVEEETVEEEETDEEEETVVEEGTVEDEETVEEEKTDIEERTSEDGTMEEEEEIVGDKKNNTVEHLNDFNSNFGVEEGVRVECESYIHRQGGDFVEQNNLHSDSNLKFKDSNNMSQNKCKTKLKNSGTHALFKKPLPVPLSKGKVQAILDKIPLSELKKKKRKSIVSDLSQEQMQQNEIEEALRKRQKQKTMFIKKASNKLKRPKKWVTPKFYEFIINKLQPQFGIKSRVRAERLVLFLVEHVDRVMKEENNFNNIIEEMKNELAYLKIITTHWDFYQFVRGYFDGYFFEKVYYVGLGSGRLNFGCDDPFDSIL